MIMQNISQLIFLIVFSVLVATTCMARNVVNPAGINDHLQKIVNKPLRDDYCGNITALITINVYGCYGDGTCDSGNATITHVINACGDLAPLDISNNVRRFVSACDSGK